MTHCGFTLFTLYVFEPHTKDASVDKVHQTEVLKQIILNGSARNQDSALGIHYIQSLVRLII